MTEHHDHRAGASDPGAEPTPKDAMDTTTAEYVRQKRATTAPEDAHRAPQRPDWGSVLARLPEAARDAYRTATTPQARAAAAADRAEGIAEARDERLARQAAARDDAWRRCKPAGLAHAGIKPLHEQQDRSHHSDGTPIPGTEGAVSGWWASDRQTLLLVGPTRRGKSWAAWAVGEQARQDGAWVVGYSAPTLIDHARPGAVDNGAAWHGALTADLLIVDDLGRDRQTDWSLERWYVLVETRLTSGLRTVVTTNEGYDDLVGRYGDPIVQRIIEGGRIVRIEGRNLADLGGKPW